MTTILKELRNEGIEPSMLEEALLLIEEDQELVMERFNDISYVYFQAIHHYLEKKGIIIMNGRGIDWNAYKPFVKAYAKETPWKGLH